MLRSMTGFGRCVMEDADWTQTWEIRSVNNRHLDLKWRLPLQARGLESRLERVVRRFAAPRCWSVRVISMRPRAAKRRTTRSRRDSSPRA